MLKRGRLLIWFRAGVVVMSVASLNLFAENEPQSVYPENKKEKLFDPTRPLGFREQKKPAVVLTLQAVYNKGGVRQAVINGEVLQEGDRYKSHKIKVIREKSVVYEKDGTIQVVKLRPSIL